MNIGLQSILNTSSLVPASYYDIFDVLSAKLTINEVADSSIDESQTSNSANSVDLSAEQLSQLIFSLRGLSCNERHVAFMVYISKLMEKKTDPTFISRSIAFAEDEKIKAKDNTWTTQFASVPVLRQLLYSNLLSIPFIKNLNPKV
jgi:hypothetical protein